MSDIKSVMKEYGQFRLSDLYKEHQHQCTKLEVIVESFAGGPSRFTTFELLQAIRKNVIERFGMPVLDGIDIEPRELAVAHFLYRIGFINARDERATQGETLHFIRFEDRPHLLKGKQNLDDGLPWEVHPAYRSVLRMEGGYAESEDEPRKRIAKASAGHHKTPGKRPVKMLTTAKTTAASIRIATSEPKEQNQAPLQPSAQSRRRKRIRSFEKRK